MSNTDLRSFLEDLVNRFDPSLSLSGASRAQAELIEPIMARIGTDPFDDDISVFVRERVAKAYPNMKITEVDALSDLFIAPMQVLMEPLVREVKLAKLRSSLSNIASLSDAEVDSLMANFFDARKQGGYARGVVRLYFNNPVSVSATMANVASTKGGLRFVPAYPQQITSDQMTTNTEGSEYYFDVAFIADKRGDEYNVEKDTIISITNMPAATRVRNPRRFRYGAARETSLDYAARVQSKLGDRTLATARGVLSELYDNFTDLKKVQVIGHGDPEMTRDVVTGGAYGEIVNKGMDGLTPDDTDGDATTQYFQSATATFLTDIGAAGTEPTNVILTLASPTFQGDVDVVEVISNTRVKVSEELTVGETSVPWFLRKKEITITNIPGGVTLPQTIAGTLQISPGEVHIGGKTDIYVAGPLESSTALITALADEERSAWGPDAQTDGTNQILLNDFTFTFTYVTDNDLILPGSTLVLQEGDDEGAYKVYLVENSGGNCLLTVDRAPAATATGLYWYVTKANGRQELTSPKRIKYSGTDVATSANNSKVTGQGVVYFDTLGVLPGDILELDDDIVGGEYTVTSVSSSIEVSPAPIASRASVPAKIYTRSEAVDVPVVTVDKVELVDTNGAPKGIEIPPRDPVAIVSRGVASEGNYLLFDGQVITGLTSFNGVLAPYTYAVGGRQISIWAAPADDPKNATDIWQVTFIGPPDNPMGVTSIASAINAAPAGILFGSTFTDFATAKEVSLGGYTYLAIIPVPGMYVEIEYQGGVYTEDQIMEEMGWPKTDYYPVSSASVRPFSTSVRFCDLNIKAGDSVEFIRSYDSAHDLVGHATRVADGVDLPALTPQFRVGLGPKFRSYLNTYDANFYSLDELPVGLYAAKISRPSTGALRLYFQQPTATTISWQDTRFTYTNSSGQEVQYAPASENQFVLVPPAPTTDLTDTLDLVDGGGPGPSVHTDTTKDFLALGVKPGDVLELLYERIYGNTLGSGALTLTGTQLGLRLYNTDDYLVEFTADITRTEAVDLINSTVGVDVAFLDGSNTIYLMLGNELEVTDTNATLGFSTVRNNSHPSRGLYYIWSVPDSTTLWSNAWWWGVSDFSNAVYRILRYGQNLSSSEMSTQTDETGLYYQDVDVFALGAGEEYNLPAGAVLTSDNDLALGYRIYSEDPSTSFSRADKVWIDYTPTINVVGVPNSYGQNLLVPFQNVQITYRRSQLADDIQSFCDSDQHRTVAEEILVKHLLPHEISLNWAYTGGAFEVVMTRKIEEYLDSLDPDEQLEVGDLASVLREEGATSIYSPDASSASGRSSPLIIAVYQDASRKRSGAIVRDFTQLTRLQRFVPGTIRLARVSPSGLRR